MGCGASAPVQATTEQMTQLCAVAAKDMVSACVGRAFQQADKIKVTVPPEIARVREDVANLRIYSAGVLSGRTVAETALKTMADELEKVIDGVEASFIEVGKDIVKQEEKEIKKVIDMTIANMALSSSALALCRGDEPCGAEEYAKVPTNAVMDHLIRKCGKQNLVAQLLPVCEEAIKKHKVTSNWDSLITKVNSLSAKIDALDFAKIDDASELALKPIELDIKEYIVSQCVEELANEFGMYETVFRSLCARPSNDPEVFLESYLTKMDKPHPQTFMAVFSGLQLTEKHFKAIEKGV